MTDLIEVQWSSGSIDEARKICRYLVQERLVASSQIIPWVESIYMLNNQLETTQESKILLKTQLRHFEKIKEIITQNSKYELPEITYTPITGGSTPFLRWIEESTPNQFATQTTENSQI